MVQSPLENTLAVSFKTKNKLTKWTLLNADSRELKADADMETYTSVHNSFILIAKNWK